MRSCVFGVCAVVLLAASLERRARALAVFLRAAGTRKGDECGEDAQSLECFRGDHGVMLIDVTLSVARPAPVDFVRTAIHATSSQ